MSLAKRRNSNSDNSHSLDATAAVHRHPALHWTGTYDDNSSVSDTTTCYHKEMLAAPAPLAQPNAVDAAALLAEAWCSTDSTFECEIDNFAGEGVESLMMMLEMLVLPLLWGAGPMALMLWLDGMMMMMMMLENELLAAAAAAATAAATTQQLPLQLSALSCMGGGSNKYCNSRINNAAAPAAMPAAAAAAAAVTATVMPASAAARLQMLQTQFAALQVELMALKNMHAELLVDVQQINNNAGSDATAAWAFEDHAGYHF
jgi:hypothetical protein